MKDINPEIEIILKEKINELKNVILNMTDDIEIKIKINENMDGISINKILMFIMFIKDKNIEKQIKEFLNKANIDACDENVKQIEVVYKYFFNNERYIIELKLFSKTFING